MIKASIFGRGCRLDHIGLAVASIKKEQLKLGLKKLKIYPDKTQRVKVAFFELDDAPIELIEPLRENSPVDANLKKNQPLVHLCFKVLDLEKATAKAAKYGFRPITKPVPAPAFGGRKIVWLYHPSLGLFELVEKTKDKS